MRITGVNTADKPKWRAISLMVFVELTVISLWFSSAAVLPDMAREADLSDTRQALLSSGVQAGFVLGALFIAMTAIADRLNPCYVMATCALGASTANAVLLFDPIGGWEAVSARAVTGALLAGVYPVGMKIAVGWG
ncbi:MAG: hypothetical protein HOI95_28610 [Chromatiales bacterium]|jgi:predicted MFS family arabinose efflux permease|nr:hypothetical protein [Chromatiales bacterium]